MFEFLLRLYVVIAWGVVAYTDGRNHTKELQSIHGHLYLVTLVAIIGASLFQGYPMEASTLGGYIAVITGWVLIYGFFLRRENQ